MLECKRAERGAGSSEIPQGCRQVIDVLHIQSIGLTEGSHKTRVAENLQNKSQNLYLDVHTRPSQGTWGMSFLLLPNSSIQKLGMRLKKHADK